MFGVRAAAYKIIEGGLRYILKPILSKYFYIYIKNLLCKGGEGLAKTGIDFSTFLKKVVH